MVGLVQLVRAPVCGTGGHRFESDIPPHFFWITPVTIGVSPSGKARDFDSLTRGFESRLPSQRPLGGGCDPLAQLAEHLTFNQGVRSSNLRWITSKFPLKSPIFGYFRGFFMPFLMNTFVRNFRHIITIIHHAVYRTGDGSLYYPARPRHRHLRLFARFEGPFFCSFEFTLQNTIYLLK